jgi:RNA polymerase sigma-70 factor (ECF subfamily)
MGERALGGGTDAEVIRSSLTDPESFAAIFERHAAPVHRYLVTRVGRGAAEDLVGDTFATAFRSRSTYEPTGCPPVAVRHRHQPRPAPLALRGTT